MALGGRIQIAGFDLLDVIGQQLHAMRIDAAQIRGDQGIGDQSRRALRNVRRNKNCFGEAPELRGAYLASDAQRISSSLRM